MISIKYNKTYIKDWYSVASKDEEKGNIKNIDYVIDDYYFDEATLEDAEVKMQKVVIDNLSKKHNFDLIIGGDLSNQLGTMNKTMRDFDKSYLGIYNACATFIEGLIISSNMLESNISSKICVLTSSHTLTSERQFRFPIEYGSLKACYTTITMTGSVGSIVTNVKTKYKIVGSTIGKVVDYGVSDVFNIGAIMAPAAANVIYNHLKNFNRQASYYDIILTGDLGSLGLELLNNVLASDYNIHTNNIIDAGTLVYKKSQKKYLGASGPTVLPFVFFNKIINSKKYKKILLVGTGALHNPTLVNQKNTIPAIAHAIEIEVQS